MKLFLACLVGAILNRFRGGGATEIIGHEIMGEKWIYSIFVAIFLLDSPCPVCFCAILLAVRGSISWGWGSYISGLFNNRMELRGDIVWLDKLAITIKKPFLANTFALAVRGFMLGGAISLVLLDLNLFHHTHYVWELPVCLFGILFPLSYVLGNLFKENKWTIAELFFGAFSWFVYYFI